MRTTLDVDDAILREAKARAASEGTTLTRVVERALREHLHPSAPKGKPFKLRLLTKKGSAAPSVDVADRDALYDRMEGRD